MRLLIALLLLSSPANAYESGVCRSMAIPYKDIEFKLEQATDFDYAIDFQKKHRGQMITDSNGIFSIIWHDQVEAPASQYVCGHINED